jgi:PDZ domain
MGFWIRTSAAAAALAAVALAARLPVGAQQPAVQSPSVKIKFTLGGDAAEVPAKFLDNVPFFPVRVNQSEPWLFVLDSTAASSSIDSAVANALGASVSANPVLNLDGFDLPVAGLPASPRKDFAAALGRPYEGTLGEELFSSAIVSLDYARQTAQVYDPDTFHYSGPGKALPLRFEGPLPVVQAKFEVTGKTFEADFAIDTALDAGVLISKDYAAKHKVLPSHIHRVIATDDPLDANAVAVRFKTFQLGPYSAEGPIADFGDTLPALKDAKPGDAKLAGEIGGGMLRRYTAIFDYPHKQLILQPNTSLPDDDPGDMSGLSLVASGPALRRFQVVAVQPGSPGAEAKIQKGDVIAGVDMEPAADFSLADLRGLFTQVGHTYKLLLDRNGQEVQVSVQMHRLL